MDVYPNTPKIVYNWANNLQNQNRWPEAMELYERVLELQPTYFGALNNMGSAYEVLGRSLVSVRRQFKLIIVYLKIISGKLHSNRFSKYALQNTSNQEFSIALFNTKFRSFLVLLPLPANITLQ